MNLQQSKTLRQWICDVNTLGERYGYAELAGTPDLPKPEYVELFNTGMPPEDAVARKWEEFLPSEEDAAVATVKFALTEGSSTETSPWVGRGQEILSAVRTHLNGDINTLTAGRILEILHDTTGKVTLQDKVTIRGILTVYPGYNATSEESGLYHYQFVRQLEFVCENARQAHANASWPQSK